MTFNGWAARLGRIGAPGVVAVTLTLALVPGAPGHAVAASSTPASASTTISLGEYAGGAVAVDAVTDTAYVTMKPFAGASLPPEVGVIDLSTDTMTATIPVPANPTDIAVDPATDVVYEISAGTGTVTVINGATNTVTGSIAVSGPITGSAGGIDVDPATDTVYAGVTTNGGAGVGVAVINGATNAVTGTIPVSSSAGVPLSLAVDPATDTIYAGFSGPDLVGIAPAGLYVISGATNSLTTTITFGNGYPVAIAVDPATDVFYVGWDDAPVTAYSGATNAVLETSHIGAAWLTVNPDTNTVYGTTPDANEAFLIDGATGAVTGNFPLEGPNEAPAGIAVDPDTDTLAVVNGSTIVIIPLQAPSITSAASATLTADQADSFSFTATGTPPPAFSETGALPAGLRLSTSGILSGVPAPGTVGSYPVTVSAANGVGSAATQAFTLQVAPEHYTPVTPTGILDTRSGIGAAKGAVAANGDLSLQIPSVDGVSGADMSAVVLNVTVTSPTSSGALTVFTTPGAGVSTSNIDFTAGQTIANMITIQPVNGEITFQNNGTGTVQIIADLDGYYSDAGTGFQTVAPVRVLDTRNKIGTTTSGPVASHATLRLNLAGQVPAGATAAVLNLTVTQPTASGFITAFADGQPVPGTSNVNFTAGQTIPNQVIVPLTNDVADFYNGAPGTVQLVADLSGYYAAAASGSFVPFGPERIVDTRSGLGTNIQKAAVPAHGTLTVSPDLLSAGCNPACPPAAADVLNVTVTQPQAAGDLVVYASGLGQPATSNLNFSAGQTISNLVTTQSGNGQVIIYNGGGGSVQIVIDEQGYFVNQP